jgi:hypothetical protein
MLSIQAMKDGGRLDSSQRKRAGSQVVKEGIWLARSTQGTRPVQVIKEGSWRVHRKVAG